MDQRDSSRNFRVLILSSSLFGLAFGIYDLALPLFMHASGFTALQGSLVFAVPLGVSIVLRLWIGRFSDFLGRKVFYTLSMFGAAVCSFLTPFFPIVSAQVGLRSLWMACQSMRDTLHSVFLYETAKEKFISIVGKTNAAHLVFQAAGLILVGYGLGWVLPGKAGAQENYMPVLMLSSAAALAASAALAIGLREQFRTAPLQTSVFLKELVSVEFDARLYVLMAAMIVFSIGLGTCHTYTMYVFWQDRFGISRSGMGWLMAAHRLAFAVSSFMAGFVVRGWVHKHRRGVMMALICVQGVTTAAAGIIPQFWPALVVWLMHDLLGAGVWSPIRQSLLQRYSRGHVRGTDTAKALAIGEAGMIVGALLAGWLYRPEAAALVRAAIPLPGGDKAHLGLPFLVGGVITVVSVVPLLALLVMDPEERGEAATNAAG